MTHMVLRDHPIHGELLVMDNGVLEVGVPLSFGLRIAHFSFSGEENVFFVQPPEMTRFTTEQGWRIRGGHRLWLAPERAADYEPDNDPIRWVADGDTLHFEQKTDLSLDVAKFFSLTLEKNRLRILHRVRNDSVGTITCALWALTVLKPGGVLTVPLPRREGGMDPLYRLSLWDYSDLGDGRLRCDREAIRIVSKPISGPDRLKFGVGHPAGPVSYRNGNAVFYKYIPLVAGGDYPDGGVSFEAFVCGDMTEIEGLSPMQKLRPGETAEYEEILELCRTDGGR